MDNNTHQPLASFAADHGLQTNQHGRVFENGKAMDMAEKVRIGHEILNAMLDAEEQGTKINISSLSRQCKTSRATITKIRDELNEFGRVLRPEEISLKKSVQRGVGIRSLTDVDVFIIVQMYAYDPSTTLRNYVKFLFLQTGTVVSKSTISRFFVHGFPIRGSMCKPNLIPFDKFRPANFEKALIYMHIVSCIDPKRIKFGDEKHLEGRELWCRKVRRSIFTGEIPGLITHPNFIMTYTISGFCGIDRRVSAMRYGITMNNNNSESFSTNVVLAVSSGFLQQGDVLVLDNAAIHTSGTNSDLESWLWDNFRIFLLWLPARTPEWNPIELVWNVLVSRLGVFSLEVARCIPGTHSLVVAADMILQGISHEEVQACYEKSGYMCSFV